MAIASNVVARVFNDNTTQLTYLPNCTSSVSYSDWKNTTANAFDLRHWDWYKGQLKYAIGGWVAAGICLVLAIAFLLWVLTLCCCGCCGGVRRWSRADRQNAAAAAAFKADPNTNPRARFSRWRGRHGLCSLVLCPLIVVLLLVMLATASWGLANGLKATDHLSDNFWKVIDTARIKVGHLNTTTGSFFDSVSGLQSSLYSIGTVLQGVNLTQLTSQVDLPLNLTDVANDQASGLVNTLGDSLGSIASQGNDIQYQIQRYGVRTLANLEDDYRGKADNVQNIYAPLVLGVVFGVLVLLALLATGLLLARHVRSGGAFLAMLWFWTALYFFVGPGLLHFGYEIASDACLYPESFVFKVVNDTGLTTENQGRITTGLSYYFGGFGTNLTLDELIQEIYGLDIGAVSSLANNTLITSTVTTLASNATQLILQAQNNLNSTQQAALASAPDSLDGVIQGFNRLQTQVARSNYAPLYLQVKQLLCCTLADRVRHAWIAWTVAAAMAGLLCIALTIRAFQAVRGYSSRAPPQDVNHQFIVGGGGPPPGAPPPQQEVPSYAPRSANNSGHASGYGRFKESV